MKYEYCQLEILKLFECCQSLRDNYELRIINYELSIKSSVFGHSGFAACRTSGL
jgi:hypothetical protein